MTILPTLLLLLFCLAPVHAQTLTKVMQGTKTVKFAWDYSAADEAKIDDFQLQRTGFDFTSVPTGPYPVIIGAISKTSREYVFVFQDSTAIEVGRKSYFVLVARKTGLANSAPSNIVAIEIIAPTAPLPSPTNIRIE